MSHSSDVDRDADSLEAELTERYAPRLRLFALRQVRTIEAAEDVAQETVRRVLVALREGRVLDLQALPAYIFETARHVCAHHLRGGRRADRAHAAIADVMAARPADDALSAIISAERLRAVRRAVADLPAEDRKLLRLTFAEGLTSEAIAVRLGLSAVNVRVRKHRLKKELARRLHVTAAGPGAPEGGT